MSEIKHIMMKYITSGDVASMHFLADKLADFVDHHHDNEHLLFELKSYICPFYDEHTVEHIVSDMVNEDGSKGGKFSYKQALDIAHKHGVHDDELNKFYYTLNMVYSDLYCPRFGEEDYVHLAIKFMHDKDAPKDKVERYYRAMHY